MFFCLFVCFQNSDLREKQQLKNHMKTDYWCTLSRELLKWLQDFSNSFGSSQNCCKISAVAQCFTTLRGASLMTSVTTTHALRINRKRIKFIIWFLWEMKIASFLLILTNCSFFTRNTCTNANAYGTAKPTFCFRLFF